MDCTGPITQEVLAERRARFQAQLEEGVAIVPGARTQRRSNDVEYVFRQSSDFWYLTGFPQPDAIALLTADRYVLFVQPRDPAAETWTGRRPGVEGAVREYAADEAYPTEEFANRLPGWLENVPRLYHRFGDDRTLDEIVLHTLKQLAGRQRQGVTPPEEFPTPQSILHEMRLRKDEPELAIMRAAAEISREAHYAAARLCRKDRWEYELEAALGQVFRARGGAGPAYPSIVGAGENAAVLHYTENRSRLAKGDLVLVDAGVELHGYASDVTRTYPVDGLFEGVRRDLYTIVLEAQRCALEAVRAGTTLPALHDRAVHRLVEGLVALGVLQGGIDDLIEQESYRPFYMHSTGHFLGLDVHDVGRYHVGGQPRPLEPGMVFTVEPGLYFGRDCEQAPEALRGIGVRIEDDVALGETGPEVLTASIPKEIDDVEAWMRD
ncbi:MAG: aminopeptidase P N-terminal domain-containing protein [Myxococcota bacterium]